MIAGQGAGLVDVGVLMMGCRGQYCTDSTSYNQGDQGSRESESCSQILYSVVLYSTYVGLSIAVAVAVAVAVREHLTVGCHNYEYSEANIYTLLYTHTNTHIHIKQHTYGTQYKYTNTQIQANKVRDASCEK